VAEKQVIDKKVITGDFKGIKPNMLVRDKQTNLVGLCLDTMMVPNYLGEGHYEAYDYAAVVLVKGRRAVLPIENLEICED